MRVIPSLLLILCLAACQRGHDNEAVRLGVVDHLTKAQYNVSGMDIKVTDVKFNGDQADATVAFTAKGQTGVPAMSFRYHLLHQNNQWVVQGPAQDTGGSPSNPHGGAMPAAAGGAMPPAGGADNPHGGAMPPAGAGQMPSPHDLPPAKKK